MPPFHRSTPVVYSAEVQRARQARQPLVALESTVITHGLPWPDNLQLALDMEKTIRQAGAVPATIAVLDGRLHIGLEGVEIEKLAADRAAHKISLRDIGAAAALGFSGGTTVAATMFAAELAEIPVFATGGIGGVHRGNSADISADLIQLGRSPVVVVCAGAKAILDIPRTVEFLETQGVPVIGYQTDAFPAFYSSDSGLSVDVRVDSGAQAAAIAQAHWGLGLRAGLLVVVPPPAEAALPAERVETAIESALRQAEQAGVHGSALTPFLLARVSELTGGESLKTNLALLLRNAAVATEIARHLGPRAPQSKLV